MGSHPRAGPAVPRARRPLRARLRRVRPLRPRPDGGHGAPDEVRRDDGAVLLRPRVRVLRRRAQRALDHRRVRVLASPEPLRRAGAGRDRGRASGTLLLRPRLDRRRGPPHGPVFRHR